MLDAGNGEHSPRFSGYLGHGPIYFPLILLEHLHSRLTFCLKGGIRLSCHCITGIGCGSGRLHYGILTFAFNLVVDGIADRILESGFAFIIFVCVFGTASFLVIH